MREVNMESLAISPPEESKQFLDGMSLFPKLFYFFFHFYKDSTEDIGFD